MDRGISALPLCEKTSPEHDQPRRYGDGVEGDEVGVLEAALWLGDLDISWSFSHFFDVVN